MIDIRLGDSFELLKEFEDKSVDTILTDAPYNLSRDQIDYFHSQFLRISREWVIVFMPPENQWVLPADQYLIWEKPSSTKNVSRRYSRFVEMIFVYGDGTWNTNRHWSQYTNIFRDLVDDSSIHPYRKPPSLIERLVRNHTNDSMTILDPFAGSFVIGEVCQRLNRNYIGIEREETYFKLAKEKFNKINEASS